MSRVPAVEILVTPADCDPQGRVAQPQFLSLFDRARWEAFAAGPGVDLFARQGTAAVVRKATLEYFVPAAAGMSLRFELTLTHLGGSSFTLQHTARRADDDSVVVAEAEFVFVCVDGQGAVVPVPGDVRTFFGARPSVRAGAFRHMVVNGVTTAVDVQGDGTPVLFVHGFPLDRTVWRHLMAPLTGRRRIAPDLRGLGLSDVPADGYSMTQYADDMFSLLDQLGEERAVVCGLSMGGHIAFDMVRRFPERIVALVLVNSRAEADGPQAKEARNDMIRTVQQEGAAAIADVLVPKLLAPESISTMPQVAERVHTMIKNSSPAGVVGALKAMRDRPDSSELLESVSVPTLVIAGREDQLIPVDHARAMSKRIAGAHFTLIAGAGHLVPMEQPVPTSRVIAEFLDALA